MVFLCSIVCWSMPMRALRQDSFWVIQNTDWQIGKLQTDTIKWTSFLFFIIQADEFVGEIQCSESESECSPSSVSAWLITIFITDV